MERDNNSGYWSSLIEYRITGRTRNLARLEQFIKGQLKTRNNNQDYWMGRKCLSNSTNRQPWEKEAYSMEEQLVELFW